MGKIRRLEEDLINQIAAGEVVERPASVVKELLENALDAGATRVRVDVERGGLDLVRVSDDGEGLSPDDAHLALERHATSKIAAFEDLASLLSFGFRGEALPSIASVSRLALTTRERGTPEGTELTIDGGGPAQARPAGRAEGTTIEVRELFFNVPARRKFLKAPATESAHVGEVLQLAALSRPEVTFVLTRDGKPAREYLRAASREERARQVVGEPRLASCVGERGPMRIEAYLAPPERARAGTGALHLLVNGRPVRDRPLARAVAQAYGSVLEGGRYPVGVVYIDLPPELVDVNVHPQKAEVRFQDARAVFDAVTRELFTTLSRAFDIPAMGPTSRPWMSPPRAAGAYPLREGSSGWSGLAGSPAPLSPPSASTAALSPSAAPLPSPGPVPVPGPAAPPPSTPDMPLFDEGGFYGRLRFVAQVRNTFLLCEGDDALYVLDQHAADERRNYDRLRRAFEQRTVAVQKLLIPEIVELSPQEAAILSEHEDDAARFGVELRMVGPQAAAVHGVPRLLSRGRPERLLRDLLAELGRAAGRPFSGARDLVLATMACHGSIRAGDPMSPEQARALLIALDGVDFSGYCPHGRPVVTRVAFAELERRVGR